MAARIAFSLGLILVAAIGSSQGLSIHASPAFEGMSPSGTTPMVVEIQNLGSDSVGEVDVTSQDVETVYPVELPAGSRKILFTYPNVNYDPVDFTLTTNRGSKHVTYQPENSSYNTVTYLLIGDASGDLGFLRKPQRNSNGQVEVGSVKPESTPDRALGFSSINVIVLGSGAERLTDASVAALKLWALSGGTLVFVGGASAPLLNDPRWADTLPAQGFRTVNLPHSKLLAKLGGSPLPAFTVTTGSPALSAQSQTEDGALLIARRPVGIGQAVYLAFNPFDHPFTEWAGRGTALRQILQSGDGQARQRYLSQFTAERTDALASASPSSSVDRDPFSAKLPPASDISWILVLYFIAVVPVNFLVLKRLGRGEWAWFTAPIISLLFAGILFSRAQSLYEAKMSTATRGLLIFQEGYDRGIFLGSTQLFIPRGGLYDLRLSNVDRLGATELDRYNQFSPGGTESGDVQTVDDGEIHVPQLRANNLAFKQISYRQLVDAADPFSITAEGNGTYRVKNNGPYDAANLSLIVDGTRRSVGALAPGKSTVVAGAGRTISGDMTLESVLRPNAVALAGTLTGFRPGPQIGTEVATRSDIRFAYVASGVKG